MSPITTRTPSRTYDGGSTNVFDGSGEDDPLAFNTPGHSAVIAVTGEQRPEFAIERLAKRLKSSGLSCCDEIAGVGALLH
jgi:hypothetical protein